MSEAKYAGNGKIVCPECHGRKTVKCEKCNGHGEFSTCNNCHATGKVDCPSCGGSGKETSICPVCNEGKVVKSHWTTCHKCNGTGRRIWAHGVERTWRCPHCDGHGQVHEKYKEFCPNCHGEYKRKTDNPCKKCGGTGKIRCSRCDGSSHAKCLDCGGRGKVKCGKCGGKGYVAVDDATSVKLMQTAANEGNLQALHDLAIAYAVGQYGLPIDCGKAQEFFKSILNHEDDEKFDYFADSVEGHIKYLPAVCKGDTDAMRELADWFSNDAMEERGIDGSPMIDGRDPEKFWRERAASAERPHEENPEVKTAAKGNVANDKPAQKATSSSVTPKPNNAKKRWKFVVLGLLLGFFGIHLAYAKRWFLFLLLWAGFITGNVMSDPKKEATNVSPKVVAEQVQSESKSDKESSNPISNIGFAVWGLLWIGGTLFIKKDGKGNRM